MCKKSRLAVIRAERYTGGWSLAMTAFFAGVATALVPSAVGFAWMLWAGKIGEDPDQPTALILPFVKTQPKGNGRRTRSARWSMLP